MHSIYNLLNNFWFCFCFCYFIVQSLFRNRWQWVRMTWWTLSAAVGVACSRTRTRMPRARTFQCQGQRDSQTDSMRCVCYLLSAICYLLSAVCYLLSAVCCLLVAICCLLSAVCCLLSAVCCLLSIPHSNAACSDFSVSRPERYMDRLDDVQYHVTLLSHCCYTVAKA
jgi:hypothetical protein